MNGASTTAPSSDRGRFGEPPPPLFQLVTTGGADPHPVVGQNVVAFVFWMVKPAFQPPSVKRKPAIVTAPAPPTGAEAVGASVPRSPLGLAGVNEPATMPDLTPNVVGLSM